MLLACKLKGILFVGYIQASNQGIAEHSDSIIENGIATAVCCRLPTLRSPTASQDSEGGSQDKIEVR